VDYVIPGNDDALRATRLFASKIADRWWKAARWPPSRNFNGRQDCSDETPAEEGMVEYTEYVDPSICREDHGGEPEHGG